MGKRHNRGWKAQNESMQTELDAFYISEFKSLLVHDDKFELRNYKFLLPYLATEMHTAIHNNLKEHSVTRLWHCFVDKAQESRHRVLLQVVVDGSMHLRCEVGQQKRVVAQLELVIVHEQWLEFGCYVVVREMYFVVCSGQFHGPCST